MEKCHKTQLIIFICHLSFSSTGERLKFFKYPLSVCIRPSSPEGLLQSFPSSPVSTLSSCSPEDILVSKPLDEKSSSTPRPSMSSPFPPNWRWDVEKTLDVNHLALCKTYLLLHYSQPMSTPIHKQNKTPMCGGPQVSNYSLSTKVQAFLLIIKEHHILLS